MGQSGGRWAQGAVREVPALLRSWKRRDGERMLGDMGASLTRPRRGELQDEEVAALLSAFLESRAVVGEASEATGGFLTLLALANGDLTLRVGGVNVVPSFVKLCAQWLSCHYHAASKGDNLDGRYLAALQVMAPHLFNGYEGGEGDACADGLAALTRQQRSDFPLPEEHSFNPAPPHEHERKANGCARKLSWLPPQT